MAHRGTGPTGGRQQSIWRTAARRLRKRAGNGSGIPRKPSTRQNSSSGLCSGRDRLRHRKKLANSWFVIQPWVTTTIPDIGQDRRETAEADRRQQGKMRGQRIRSDGRAHRVLALSNPGDRNAERRQSEQHDQKRQPAERHQTAGERGKEHGGRTTRDAASATLFQSRSSSPAAAAEPRRVYAAHGQASVFKQSGPSEKPIIHGTAMKPQRAAAAPMQPRSFAPMHTAMPTSSDRA